jgi:hypothetical protein
LQQYDTSQCRYIAKLGFGPILPLLHETDATAELQLLDGSSSTSSCLGGKLLRGSGSNGAL